MSKENAQTIRRMYDAFTRGDLETVLDAFSDDVQWNLPGAAPYSGRRHGRDQVRQFFDEFTSLEQTNQFDVDDILADGDKVVAMGRERGAVKETGRTYEQRWVHVFTLRGGKITEAYFHDDTHAVASAYGASASERRATTGPLGVTHRAFSGGSGGQEL